MVLPTIKAPTIHLIFLSLNDNTDIYLTHLLSKFNLTAQHKQSEFHIEH